MRQRRKKGQAGRTQPANLQARPAGIQSMDQELYELIEQAVRQLAHSQVRVGAAG